MASTGAIRCFATWIVSALLLLCWTVAAGLRINGTHSFPPGLYLAMHKQPVTGDLVIVNLPATPILELAKAREYLNVAFSPVGRVMKRVAAVAGARVTISAEGVEVNGIRLHNSTPLPCDSAGRPLQLYALKDHVLGPSEVLLMSDYNPASFDSRYFGPLQATTIESVATPLLTF